MYVFIFSLFHFFFFFHSKIKYLNIKNMYLILFLIYQLVEKKNMMNSDLFFNKCPIIKIMLLVSYIEILFFFFLSPT